MNYIYHTYYDQQLKYWTKGEGDRSHCSPPEIRLWAHVYWTMCVPVEPNLVTVRKYASGTIRLSCSRIITQHVFDDVENYVFVPCHIVKCVLHWFFTTMWFPPHFSLIPPLKTDTSMDAFPAAPKSHTNRPLGSVHQSSGNASEKQIRRRGRGRVRIQSVFVGMWGGGGDIYTLKYIAMDWRNNGRPRIVLSTVIGDSANPFYEWNEQE